MSLVARIRSALVRSDPSYGRWVASHQATSMTERWKVVGLHLLPGALGWLSIRYLVPWLMPITGLDAAWLQLSTLGTMAIAWELAMPFPVSF